jgi:hypothetical protein
MPTAGATCQDKSRLFVGFYRIVFSASAAVTDRVGAWACGRFQAPQDVLSAAGWVIKGIVSVERGYATIELRQAAPKQH